MQISKLYKLNHNGFDHVFVSVACFVVFALIGSFYLYSSLAATTTQWKGTLEAFTQNSGYCLTANGSTAGSLVELDPCAKSYDADQVWSLNDIRTATVDKVSSVQELELQSAAGSNECLDNFGQSKVKTYPVKLDTCGTSDSGVAWVWSAKFTAHGYSTHQLSNISSSGNAASSLGLCLDEQNGSTKSGTYVGLYACKTTTQSPSNQEWIEQAAPGGSGTTSPTSLYSRAWSGYMAMGGKFTSVSGAWTVPDPGGNGSSDSVDGTWVGIGGWDNASHNLIQIGTYNDVTAQGQVSPGAFYELFTTLDTDTPIDSMMISTGDKMTAKVSEVNADTWQVSLSDLTKDKSFTKTVSFDSTLMSAEWIEEDPYNAGSDSILSPFDLFKSVSITGALTTKNGVSESLQKAGAQPIIMENSSKQITAAPSGVGAGGESFTVTGGG